MSDSEPELNIGRKILQSASEEVDELIACSDCRPWRPFECIAWEGNCMICGKKSYVRMTGHEV